MYLDYYGLKASPFNITSDAGLFFESQSHKEALAVLFYGIQEKKGIILITGEVGTGKTTICKRALDTLDPRTRISLILNPYFSDVQLLQAIVEDFGLRADSNNRLDIVKRLNAFLIETASEGGNAVLIIDEAQNLGSRQLEQVRLLSNLETSQCKLLQIVLVGQPELMEKLNQFNLRQIRQRIFVKYHLAPLAEEEVKGYVEFRLKNTGSKDIEITPAGYQLIYKFSGGIPRLVNMLCDRALLLGFAEDKKVLDENVFQASIAEIK